MANKCVWEGTWRGKYGCAYVARVRVKVRAGDNEICREGRGSGHGRGYTPGEAHESALKEAETDAMKRALTTFGHPLGLALYDRLRIPMKAASEPGGKAATDSGLKRPLFQRSDLAGVTFVLGPALSAGRIAGAVHHCPGDWARVRRR